MTNAKIDLSNFDFDQFKQTALEQLKVSERRNTQNLASRSLSC